MRLIRLASRDELRAHTRDWDDLWLRSDVANPRLRAALLASWLEAFDPQASFRAVLVEHAGQLVAALPLVENRLQGMLPTLSFPDNAWTSCGDFLLDPAAPTDEVLRTLVGGLRRESPALLWLNWVAFETPRWQGFLAAAREAGMACSTRRHYDIGQVAIEHNWEEYEAKLDGKHRRNRKRNARMLEAAGGCRLRTYTTFAPGQLEELFYSGFGIEDKSWKGAEGTSLLKTTEICQFYLEEARQLAALGHLELNFLDLAERPIAFEYGYRAKGVHFLPKIGCDDTYGKFGPGQQLVMRILERLHADPEFHLFDFAGPLVPWSRTWITSSYPVGRVVISLSKGLDRLVFRAYDRWYPLLKKRLERWRKPALAEAPAEPE